MISDVRQLPKDEQYWTKSGKKAIRVRWTWMEDGNLVESDKPRGKLSCLLNIGAMEGSQMWNSICALDARRYRELLKVFDSRHDTLVSLNVDLMGASCSVNHGSVGSRGIEYDLG